MATALGGRLSVQYEVPNPMRTAACFGRNNYSGSAGLVGAGYIAVIPTAARPVSPLTGDCAFSHAARGCGVYFPAWPKRQLAGPAPHGALTPISERVALK